ncbi:hypothetical protein AHW50_09610 [Salmonella enterica subsp. diarizonae]|nr:hypothetical protein [Salmonella enterica subsp. diarizonae]
MDLLEASAQLERIELLAKIAHVSDISDKDKTIALIWISEIVEEMRKELNIPIKGSSVRIRSEFIMS